MGSPLLPLALAGGAFLLISSKKNKPRSPSTRPRYVAPTLPTTPVSKESSWTDKQKALKAISQVEFTSKGGGIPLCSKCDPGDIDGVYGPKTKSAIKAFQAISGLDVDGNWGKEEDAAMHSILTAISNDEPISCDPLTGYPAPFACFSIDGKFALLPGSEIESNISYNPKYGPEDYLVIDPDCNYILHQDAKWFIEQKRRAIESALDGMTDSESAHEIHESMMADYSPLCLSLGISGVGPGVREFWNSNVSWIFSLLRQYELIPELLEEDAVEFGLL